MITICINSMSIKPFFLSLTIDIAIINQFLLKSNTFLTIVRSCRFCVNEILLVHSPNALVQSAEFSHQLCGSFVLIAAQVVHSLYGLRC